MVLGELFYGSSLQKETVVDVKCSGDVVPDAPATVDVPAGIDKATFQRCIEFCKNEGVPLMHLNLLESG